MTAPLAQRIFDSAQWRPEQPLRVVLIGTDWEVRVWEALLQIPMGRLTTYSGIAGKVATAHRRARGRRRRRQEPDLLRGAVPSRRRQDRRAHRLSLGPHPQARHARLGSGPGRSGGVVLLPLCPRAGRGLGRGLCRSLSDPVHTATLQTTPADLSPAERPPARPSPRTRGEGDCRSLTVAAIRHTSGSS